MDELITNDHNVFAFLVGCWKQPIPTNLNVVFGEDYRCQRLYEQLILHACNKETATLRFGNVLVEIKRGQTIYGRNKYSDYLQWTASTVDRALIKLDKEYGLVNMQRTKNYSIVTLLNYEQLIKMNNLRASNEPPMNTSKTLETIKSVNHRSGQNIEKETTDYINCEGINRVQNMKTTLLGDKYGIKQTSTS